MIEKAGFVKGNANFSLHEQRRLADKKIVKQGTEKAQPAKTAQQIAQENVCKDGMGGVVAQPVRGEVAEMELQSCHEPSGVKGAAGLLFSQTAVSEAKAEGDLPIAEMHDRMRLVMPRAHYKKMIYSEAAASRDATDVVNHIVELKTKYPNISGEELFDAYATTVRQFQSDQSGAKTFMSKACELTADPAMSQISFMDIWGAMSRISAKELNEPSLSQIDNIVAGADQLAKATKEYGHERFKEITDLYCALLDENMKATRKTVKQFPFVAEQVFAKANDVIGKNFNNMSDLNLKE